MLQDATIAPDSTQGCLEAPIIVSELPGHSGRRASTPVPAPTSARWMSYHPPRPLVAPGIPAFIPWVHIWQTEVGAILEHIEGCYHDFSAFSHAGVAFQKRHHSVESIKGCPHSGCGATYRHMPALSSS